MSRFRLVPGLLVISYILTGMAFAGGASNQSASTGTSESGGVATAVTGNRAAPVVTSFRISPALAAPGQFVNFSWKTANAAAFQVIPEIAQDEQTLPPIATAYSYNTNALAKTTTFQGMASIGSIPSASATATLTIVPVTLTASVTTVHGGQSVTLSYSGPNNDSTWILNSSNSDAPITLNPGCAGNSCSGRFQTGPLSATTTFSLELQGPAPTGGQAFSPRAIVKVDQPTTLTFKAQSQNLQPGGAVTLSWGTTNASSVSIDGVGQLYPVAGGSYCCVHPTQTTTYTATATPIYPGASPVKATTMVTISTGGLSNLNHIIFLVQENRSFENYFGFLAQYRVNHDPPIQGAQMSDVDDLHVLPPDFNLCNPNNLCFPLFHARTECTENLSPQWDETHYDMHLSDWNWLNVTQDSQFLMDLFLDTNWVNGKGGQWDTEHTRPLGYYDQRDLPYYYELATQFTTSDTWYSPIPGGTVPNRMYLFAGTTYGHAFAPGSPTDPAWQQPTIFRLLQSAGITWRYYYQDNSVFLAQWADWNDPKIQGNVRNIQEFFNYLADPNADKLLPQVVFIERASQYGWDEHPLNNIQLGSYQASQMINGLIASAAWPDSAFILTYDEGGGLFDHQPPILVTPPDALTPQDLGSSDIQGLFNVSGFRVPMIVVSPWVKPQTIVHLPTDSTSILRLIEDRFNLPRLSQRDATTGDMTDPQNGFFDFSYAHLLQPPALPFQPATGVCDQTLSGIKTVQIYRK